MNWVAYYQLGSENVVLTKALEAYGKRFRLIAAIVLPVGIVTGLIITLIINSRYFYKLGDLMALNTPAWLLSPLWIGALIYALSMLEAEQEFTYKTVLIHGFKKWWKLALIGFIVIGFRYLVAIGSDSAPSYFICLQFLLFFFIIMRYLLIFPVLTLENRGAIGSLRRCAELSKGNRGNMLIEFIGLLVLFKVVEFLITLLLGIVANLLGGAWFSQVFLFLVMGVIDPMLTALIIVWIYYYYLERKQLAEIEQQTCAPSSVHFL